MKSLPANHDDRYFFDLVSDTVSTSV